MVSKLRKNLERLAIATVASVPLVAIGAYGTYDRNQTEANGGKIANPHVFNGGFGRVIYDSDGDGSPDYTITKTFLVTPATMVEFKGKPTQEEIDWYKSTPFKSR